MKYAIILVGFQGSMERSTLDAGCVWVRGNPQFRLKMEETYIRRCIHFTYRMVLHACFGIKF